MIQRIQSVYLMLAGLLLLLMYKIPIAVFAVNGQYYELFACHIFDAETKKSIINVLPMAVLPLLSLIFSFITLFKYKNRTFQMKLGKLNILILSALIVVESIYFFRISQLLEIAGKPGFSAIIPLVSIILLILANRAILKDDKLVRSADRIR